MAFPTAGILDTFTGTNGTDLQVYSANWQSPVSGVVALEIQSNAATGTSAGGVNWQTWATAYGPSEEVYVTLTTTTSAGQYAGLFTRVVNESSASTTDGYFLRYLDGTFQFYRVDNGAQTAVGPGISQTMSNGDAFGIESVGSTHTIYYKASGGSWASLGTRTEATYSAAGKFSLITGSTSVRFDDFGGGTAAVPVTATTSLSAAIQAARTAAATVTAGVQDSHTATASVDGVVQQAKTVTASADSAVQAALSATSTMDAAVQEGKTVSASASAAVSEARAATATLAAAVQAAMSAGASVDAAVLAAVSASATISAYIVETGAPVVSATLTAAIQAARTATASLEAAIQDSHAVAATIDAAVSEAKNTSATADAAVQAPVSVQATLSAAVAAAVTTTATVSAAVQVAQSATATVDAYIYAASTATTTITAAVQAGLSASATISAYIITDATDSEKIALILKILANRQELDPATGTFRLYDDDGTTILYEVSAWEDVAGTIPYRGLGLQKLDRLE